MKKLLLILFALPIVFSCKKDDDSDVTPQQEQNRCFVTGYTRGNDIMTFKYDDENRLISEILYEDTVFIYSKTYEYSSGKLIKSKHYSEIGATPSELNYIYSNDLPIKIQSPDASRIYTYNYDAHSRLTEHSLQTGGNLDYKYTYTYNNNIITINTYQNNVLTAIILFEMDDKKSPFQIWPQALIDGTPFENNILKSTLKDKDGFVRGGSTYSYQYNSYNYPVKQTESGNNGITKVTNFTYNCQ